MNNFIFWGTDNFSIEVLKILLDNNIKPSYCITQPDKPKGRNLILTPPDIKIFCEKNNIKTLQFENLEFSKIPKADFYIVASYGKIIPKDIVEKPKFGTLNVHPSLLPKYRGATPIETAVLNDDKNTGVTILFVDEKMDHGNIIEQEKVFFEKWIPKIELEKKLAKIGGKMLVKILPKLITGTLNSIEQNHNEATFTKMFKKTDGEILQTDSDKTKWLKFIALNPWPGTFFFIKKNNKNIRIKITDADFENNNFIIRKVIPEGKSEMTFDSFKNGYLK